MESSFVILTESSCDLTAELAQCAGVEIVPLRFTLDGRTYAHYPDGREMSCETFYEKLRAGASAATSAANVAELSDAMETHLKAGKDILFLCFSSGLSSSRDACAIAAEELREIYPERRIETIDTLCASIGQGLLALLAGRRRLAGDSLEQVLSYVKEIKLRIAHWFTVDDLMYLRRGGRLSIAAAAAGSILQVKPILTVDAGGRLTSTDKVRGRKASIHALVRHMAETAPRDVETVILSHADAPQDAETLRALVQEQFAPKEILTVPQGPVIGSHTGPGFLALTFLASEQYKRP